MNTPRLTRLAIAFVGIGMLAACGTTHRIGKDGATLRDQTSAVNVGTRGEPIGVDSSMIGTPGYADAKSAEARRPTVARHATRAWIGARMTAVQSDEVLPPIFSERFSLNFDDRATNGRVPIGVIAERITRLTNVPVRVKQDVYGAGSPPSLGTNSMAAQGMNFNPAGLAVPATMPAPGAAAALKRPPLPPGSAMPSLGDMSGGPMPFRQMVTDVSAIEMRWDGTLASFLDQVTGRLNLSWAYRDGVVVIERYISESFELASFMGSQDYSMNLSGTNNGSSSGTGGGGGGNSASATSPLDVTEKGKIAALESLRKSIEMMVIPGGGAVVLSEGTGRFTVTTTKDVMGRVREVLKREGDSMLRQAHIQIDIYSVITNDSDERGMDWSAVLNNVTKTWGATIRSPQSLSGAVGANLGLSIVAPDTAGGGTNLQNRFGDSSAMLTLLNQVTDTAQYRPVSMVAMNRQWARKTNLKSDGYLSETTPATASSVGSGAPGLKTSSIVTGDKFLVQPAIMDNGVILLKFGVSLTELLSLFDVSAGSGATLQKVQTPVTSGTDDQTTVKLNPGEAMLVTGLSRRVSAGDVRRLGDSIPIGLGGSRKLGYKREDFMIVVRAVQM